MIRNELIDLSTAYLMGWKTITECAEWLASVDWNDTVLDQATRQVVGRLELFTTEVLEGVRPETDFSRAASEFVARETDFVYNQQEPIATYKESYASTSTTSALPGFTGSGLVVSQS